MARWHLRRGNRFHLSHLMVFCMGLGYGCLRDVPGGSPNAVSCPGMVFLLLSSSRCHSVVTGSPNSDDVACPDTESRGLFFFSSSSVISCSVNPETSPTCMSTPLSNSNSSPSPIMSSSLQCASPIPAYVIWCPPAPDPRFYRF